MYSINFTVTKKKFCLSLHYNGANSYLFVNGTEIYKFKAKDSEIVTTPLCLGNFSKDWSLDNMNKTEFNGYVYDFSVDYDATDVHDMLDVHKYLIEKTKIVYMKIFLFVKKVFLIGLTISSGFASLDSLNCLSMNNQECKTRTQVVNVNEDEMSKSNETRHKEWHKTCKSECKFGDNGCNTKQR